MTVHERARELRRLHEDSELLVLVNVWDAASARAVAALPGCRAIATASHAIANSYGYSDGENIPLDLMIDAIGRIASAVELPVTADLESGYGDPATAVRRAVAVGAVGANLEDRMQPLPEAVQAVEAAVRAGAAEGVEFVVNARTDAFLRAGDRTPEETLGEAIRRGQAFLEAGATCVFVPGRLDVATAAALVEGIGFLKVSVLAGPGGASATEFAAVGVTRVSYGPWPHRAALTALVDLGESLFGGARLPNSIRMFD
jgi:2-methylisocitrate lyase-like PEP mutase family enzyme